nr:SMR family transporter [Helicobacter sp. MIT 14-3879]
MIAWAFLFIAIIAEVIGTSFLKLENIYFRYIMMSIFISLSYYFMGIAIKKIQVGIAYAVWELLGTILIILISLFVFKESLNTNQIIGIILALIGILLINIGEKKE